MEESNNTIRKIPYQTPEYIVENGITQLLTPEGNLPIEVFGNHNLNNLAGAKWICQHMGVDEDDFYEAITTFKGASKRLEKLAEGKSAIAYKDFAHSPSKVKATTKAVKDQFPDKRLVACLELHTYSSLNADFLKEYNNALEQADEGTVFYSPHAVKIKKLEEVSPSQIAEAFNQENLQIYTEPSDFQRYLFSLDFKDSVLLLMSSGDYGGLDFEILKERISST